ncbi:MAG: TonB-dependent receptor [Gemmatimonadota bacterium]|nr:TonB-dependent receptor [Gemmatimonadota bacterium]
MATARLDPIFVTGTAVPLSAQGLGLAGSMVTAAELTARRPLFAADALRNIAGTFIDQAVGPGGPTIIRLRGGEEVFTQILMDGVQTNQNGGFFDFQGFPLTNIERIEIVRGPQSALYGSTAVSGVVQFITRRGTVGRPRIEASAGGGISEVNGGSARSTVTARGGTPDLLYSAGVGVTYNRGIHALAHDTWTRDASARIDARLHDNWELTATARYVGVESNLPVRDPGATRVPLDPNARDERHRIISSTDLTYRPTEQWVHRLRVGVYREGFEFVDLFDDVASTGQYGFSIFDANFGLDSRLWRTTADYLGSVRVSPVSRTADLQIAYGARLEREDLRDVTSGDFGDGTLELDRLSTSAFTEVRAELSSRVQLMAGVRLEKTEDLIAQLTPRASVRFTIIPSRLSLRASAGRAYKAPNLQQQYLDNPFIVSNPDLEPETSWSWDLGAQLQLVKGQLDVEMAFFRQDFSQLIQLGPVAGDTRLSYTNLSSSRIYGLEGRVRYLAVDRLLLGIDGAWLDSKITDNAGQAPSAFPVDSALPFRPAFTGTAYTEWELTKRFSTTLIARFIGRQVVLSERFSGERVDTDVYALLSAIGRLRVSPWLELTLRVENLLDSTYETAFDQPGLSRTWFFEMRVTP